jgi:hypothetical protein
MIRPELQASITTEGTGVMKNLGPWIIVAALIIAYPHGLGLFSQSTGLMIFGVLVVVVLIVLVIAAIIAPIEEAIMMRRIKREGKKEEERLAAEKKRWDEYAVDYQRGWADAVAARKMGEIDQRNNAYFRGYTTAWERETESEWTPSPLPDSRTDSRESKPI